jgi:hypothetical protein
MPNVIKYNISTETRALKMGDFWIGTGDVDKGPTGTTGYWNSIVPTAGGYTIYLNKASGGPSIYSAANDAQLISLSNAIAGQTFATAAAALAWFATQTDKIVFNRDYESIVTDGLVLNLDAGFTPSYPVSGTTWYDLAGTNNGTLTNGPTFNSANGGRIQFDGANDHVTLGNQSALGFTNGIFTVEAWTWIPSTWTAGSQYPNLISKGATAGWDSNGWALFVFRDWSGAGQKSWGCGIRNGGVVQNNVSRANCPTNTWLNVVMTLSGSNITLYENGVQVATGVQSVNPAANATPVFIGADVNLQCFPGYVAVSRLYAKSLTSAEVVQNFNAQKSRYGL